MNIVQRDPRFDHQHHHMVGQVRDFINRFLLIPILGGNDHLGRLLAHLFQNLVQAFFKQISGIGTFLLFGLPPCDQIHQSLIGELMPLVALPEQIVETAFRALMAGRPVLFHLHDQRIPVAVRRDGYNMLIVAARLALQPQFLPAPAPEAGQSFLHGDLQAFPVHICQCQHLPVLRVHHDCRNQSLFIKLQFINR